MICATFGLNGNVESLESISPEFFLDLKRYDAMCS